MPAYRYRWFGIGAGAAADGDGAVDATTPLSASAVHMMRLLISITTLPASVAGPARIVATVMSCLGATYIWLLKNTVKPSLPSTVSPLAAKSGSATLSHPSPAVARLKPDPMRPGWRF